MRFANWVQSYSGSRDYLQMFEEAGNHEWFPYYERCSGKEEVYN